MIKKVIAWILIVAGVGNLIGLLEGYAIEREIIYGIFFIAIGIVLLVGPYLKKKQGKDIESSK